MDDTPDIAARKQRFTEAARAFTQPSPTRHTKLAPFVDGIVELRQKGASLRLIRELLATVGVAVGTDTIARFLVEVNGDPPPAQPAKRSGRRSASAAQRAQLQPAAVAHASATPAPPPAPADAQSSDPPAERSRTRGPRIADPRNL